MYSLQSLTNLTQHSIIFCHAGRFGCCGHVDAAAGD